MSTKDVANQNRIAGLNPNLPLRLLGEVERARGQMDSAIRSLELVLEMLPDEQRRAYEQRLNEIRGTLGTRDRGLGYQIRGGPVSNNVVNLFRQVERRDWSIPEIQSALEARGTPAPEDSKALHNTIAYLTKSGMLRRVARGRYVVTGVGVGFDLEGVQDDGTIRQNENDE